MPSDDCSEAIERLTAEVRALREELLGKGPDELLTTRQAAQVLGLTERAMRQLAHRRTIPAVHVGRRLRFRRSDLLGKTL